MRFVAAQPGPAPPLARSVAACLASILDLELDEVPCPEGPDPWSLWRGWLGAHGMGLVPIAEPREFSWPGPWIALLPGRDGERVGVVAFGPPPDVVWAPLGGEARFETVESGYLVAPADVALWEQRASAGPARGPGRIELIAIAPAKESPLQLMDMARAIAGRGLEGDRYADGAGTFSNPSGLGYELTLVEAEQLDALELPPGRRLRYEEARRNLVTRGIDLNALVGRRFAVGEAECIGRRLCEPCAHLQRLTERGVLRGLVHRGGLRADILRGGRIAVGDEIRPA